MRGHIKAVRPLYSGLRAPLTPGYLRDLDEGSVGDGGGRPNVACRS